MRGSHILLEVSFWWRIALQWWAQDPWRDGSQPYSWSMNQVFWGQIEKYCFRDQLFWLNQWVPGLLVLQLILDFDFSHQWIGMQVSMEAVWTRNLRDSTVFSWSRYSMSLSKWILQLEEECLRHSMESTIWWYLVQQLMNHWRWWVWPWRMCAPLSTHLLFVWGRLERTGSSSRTRIILS